MERFFESGFIKDARKSTLRSEAALLFFFPKEVIPCLQKSVYSGSVYLFHAPTNLEKVMSHELAQHICRHTSKKLGFKFTWHYFRRSLITERRKIDCPEDVSEGLMGHTPSTVERQSYIKLTIKEKRVLYDKYFPYHSLVYF